MTIANTRLAIRDPTPAGNQPFRSNDGRFVCVFNGEIYNSTELVRRHRLDISSNCDGAIIPELWARLGADSLAELRGMFAIALVDSEEEILVLARDPFGIKPLYRRRFADGMMAFASEVRALSTVGPRPGLDRAALGRFLHLGALAADQSPFESIEAIPPNTAVMFGASGEKSTIPILAGPRPLFHLEGRLEIGSTFTTSVDIHLRADVPAVLLLSSGVDSGAIASAARTLGRDLHCMTVGGLGGADDESEGAAIIAHYYKHKHEVVRATIGEQDASDFFNAMQRPSIDGLNSFLVCRAVQRAGYRVALSGLGGDEALGGYSQYGLLRYLRALQLADKAPEAERFLRFAASAVARPGANSEKVARLLARGGPRTARGLNLLQREVFSPAIVQALSGVSVGLGIDDGQRDAGSLAASDCAEYLQATLLPDADAFSMCASVELRVPFVDRAVFASAARSCVGLKHRAGKRLLAEGLSDPFLLELTKRPKRGFTLPMADWLRGPLSARLAGVRAADAPIWQHLDRVQARRILSPRDEVRWANQWAFVVLNEWLCATQLDTQVDLL